MKAKDILLSALCVLALVGCEISDGQRPRTPAEPGRVLFDLVGDQLGWNCTMLRAVIALDEYLAVRDSDPKAAQTILDVYFKNMEIIESSPSLFILRTLYREEYRVQLKEEMLLDQPGAEWQVASDKASRWEWTLMRTPEGVLKCRSARADYDCVVSAEWTLGKRKSDTGYHELLIDGGGSLEWEQERERIDYRITNSLVYGRLRRVLIGGDMNITLRATTDEHLLGTVEAQFRSNNQVRILFEGATEEFYYNTYPR